MNRPIPLDVDNTLPGIELWFGKDPSSDIGLLGHLDIYAAITRGNLLVHQ